MGALALAHGGKENLPQRFYEWFQRKFSVAVDCRPIYLRTSLIQADFQLQSDTRMMLWGLPVEICIAKKHEKRA